MKAMPECSLFKHGMTISTNGGTRPCCAFAMTDVPTVRYDEDWTTRHNAWHEQSLTEWLPNCRACKTDEEAGQRSLRQIYNAEFEYAQGIALWDLKINNTCNLACRMCHATSSSVWEQIYKDNSDLDSYYGGAPKHRWWRDSVDMLHEMVDVKKLKFTGGEPFLVPQVRKIVQGLIDMDVASGVVLQLTTNGTQQLDSWYPLFAQFKHVELIVSIDAIGARYEYIRAGADWQQVSSNVEHINRTKPSNVRFEVQCLPMALNKGYTHEVEKWAKEVGTEWHLATPLFDPDFLSEQALTDPVLRKRMIEQLEIQDRVHGTDWREFINE